MELRSGNADEENILFLEDGRGGGICFVSGTRVRHAFPAHLHRSACFGVIAGGEAILEISGEERLLRTGDRYAIPAMRSHALRPIGGGWFSHRVFGTDPERCRETVRRLQDAIGTELPGEWPDGFADQSHLCRIFRRYMGVAPSTFLRNLSETSDLRAARD